MIIFYLLLFVLFLPTRGLSDKRLLLMTRAEDAGWCCSVDMNARDVYDYVNLEEEQ